MLVGRQVGVATAPPPECEMGDTHIVVYSKVAHVVLALCLCTWCLCWYPALSPDVQWKNAYEVCNAGAPVLLAAISAFMYSAMPRSVSVQKNWRRYAHRFA
jgi:hypothetical protein